MIACTAGLECVGGLCQQPAKHLHPKAGSDDLPSCSAVQTHSSRTQHQHSLPAVVYIIVLRFYWSSLRTDMSFSHCKPRRYLETETSMWWEACLLVHVRARTEVRDMQLPHEVPAQRALS